MKQGPESSERQTSFIILSFCASSPEEAAQTLLWTPFLHMAGVVPLTCRPKFQQLTCQWMPLVQTCHRHSGTEQRTTSGPCGESRHRVVTTFSHYWPGFCSNQWPRNEGLQIPLLIPRAIKSPRWPASCPEIQVSCWNSIRQQPLRWQAGLLH